MGILCIEIQTIKRNEVEILELKNICETVSSLDGLNSRIEMTEERTGELGYKGRVE